MESRLCHTADVAPGAGPAPLGLDFLPDDAMALILSLLPAEDLIKCETKLQSKRFYNLVAEKQLWLSLCCKACHNFGTRVADVDIQALKQHLVPRAQKTKAMLDRWIKTLTGRLLIARGMDAEYGPRGLSCVRLANISDTHLRSMFYKEIYKSLSAAPDHRRLELLTGPGTISASSSSTGQRFGHYASILTAGRAGSIEQCIWVTPTNRLRLFECAQSPDHGVLHRLRYTTSYDLCVVHSISWRVPYAPCSFYRKEAPPEAPASVTLYLGPGAHQVASACKGPFQVQAYPGWQTFAFEPALCIGGELTVKLTGGLQRYAFPHRKLCIQYIRAACTPILKFVPVVLPAASHDSKHADDICASTELSVVSSVTADDTTLAEHFQPVVLRYVPSNFGVYT